MDAGVELDWCCEGWWGEGVVGGNAVVVGWSWGGFGRVPEGDGAVGGAGEDVGAGAGGVG